MSLTLKTSFAPFLQSIDAEMAELDRMSGIVRAMQSHCKQHADVDLLAPGKMSQVMDPLFIPIKDYADSGVGGFGATPIYDKFRRITDGFRDVQQRVATVVRQEEAATAQRVQVQQAAARSQAADAAEAARIRSLLMDHPAPTSEPAALSLSAESETFPTSANHATPKEKTLPGEVPDWKASGKGV